MKPSIPERRSGLAPGAAFRRTLRALIVLLALHQATPAAAQKTYAETVSATIAQTLYLSVSNTTVTFPTVGVTDYVNGYVTGSANSFVTVQSNMAYHLTLAANAATMSASGVGAWSNKPASDLAVRVKPYGGSFGSATGLTTGGITVISGGTAGDYSSQQTEVEYRLLVSWASDTPGTYSLGFTYTLLPN